MDKQVMGTHLMRGRYSRSRRLEQETTWYDKQAHARNRHVVHIKYSHKTYSYAHARVADMTAATVTATLCACTARNEDFNREPVHAITTVAIRNSRKFISLGT